MATLPCLQPSLQQLLRAERDATFFRLRGGFPIPLAGAVYWGLLTTLGYTVRNHHAWIFYAFALSGTIFPLAVLLGRLFRIDFLHDRTAISDATFPTLSSMVLFWPMAFAAYSNYPQLVPLILAIGMSTAWPVMGWIYNRTALFTAHALVRAVVCFLIWTWLPAARFTLLPLSVCVLYLVTVAATVILSAPARNPART